MKTKSHFITLSIRNNILPAIFCLFTISLLLFSKQNLTATKNGLLLWANSVVPSLLPFFIATELLSHTNLVTKLGNLLNKFMKPIFNVPGAGAYAFIMGIISGYPVGAKIVTKFRQDGTCSKAECERLLAFTNNSGPLFIIGTVGIAMFGDTTTGILLFVTHLLASILVGILFRFWKWKDKEHMKSTHALVPSSTSYVHFSNLGEILATSITNAIHTVVMIGGFVVLFSVVLSILNSSGALNLLASLFLPIFKTFSIEHVFCKPFLSGILELTNGVSQLSSITVKSLSTNIVLASLLLGFGGFSILLQVLSITSKTDLSIKPYLLGKVLHGIIACLLTYTVLHVFPFFCLDLMNIF